MDFADDHRRSGLHWHRYTQIFYTLSGSYTHTINGETLEQTAGSVAMVFPYSTHEINTLGSNLEELKVISLSIDNSALESFLPSYKPLSYSLALYDGLSLPMFTRLTGDDKERADMLLTDILSGILSKAPLPLEKAFGNVNSFLSLCVKGSLPPVFSKRFETIEEHTALARDAIDFVFQNYSRPISISVTSKELGLSPNMLSAIFREITNRTYHEFLISHRLNYACDDIRYTDSKLDYIAARHGFSHSSHLIRTLVKHEAITPTEMRRDQTQYVSDFGHIMAGRKNKLSELSQWITLLDT